MEGYAFLQVALKHPLVVNSKHPNLTHSAVGRVMGVTGPQTVLSKTIASIQAVGPTVLTCYVADGLMDSFSVFVVVAHKEETKVFKALQ